MKVAFLLLACILVSAFADQVQIAEDESDIRAFNDRHMLDNGVLYFVNLSVEEETGFWASLFRIFSFSTPENDMTHLNSIAENNPVLRIDIGKASMAHSAEDFGVKSVPYVIAFFRGKEILRQKPSSSTAQEIREAIEDAQTSASVNVNADSSSIDLSSQVEVEEVHHHPAPKQASSDFGLMDTSSASSMMSKIPGIPASVQPAQLEQYKQIAQESYQNPQAAVQKYGQDTVNLARSYFKPPPSA